ncbi:MAG: ATP-dependent Clp protease ATP-binding subunit ClpC [Cognaticolwellia sp.]|jgi:ATP-dependent Clp protease ATP-binding subunit ClpC
MSNFENALSEGRDLVAAARRGELDSVHAREAEIQALEDLVNLGISVLLIGPDGVGKSSVIYGLAQKWRHGDRAIIELSTTSFMAGTKYLGEWQSKVTAIADQAQAAGVLLYIPDVWNLPKTGRTDKNDNNLLDALKPALTSKRVQLLAEVSPETLRSMERTPGFVSIFKKMSLPPMSAASVRRCVEESAQIAELDITPPAMETLLSLSGRFSIRAQPGPALAVLAHLVRRVQEDPTQILPLKPVQVEAGFSDLSGLPMFVVSRTETRPAKEIRGWFQERIVGQQVAIEAVLECIALFKAGLQDPAKPIGTFLFVGPTGVGKTELARTLARFLFGSESRLLRFDLSEYKDYHSFEKLIGNPRNPGQPAALVDPIRAQPFQVVLLDELEKAHPNIWDLLLGLLDEGRITPANGQTVDCRNTIVIATSNVGAQDSQRTAVGFGGGASESQQRRAVEKALEQHFRPEFLNRFGHLAVFHALTVAQVTQVARWEIKRVIDREGITARNLIVEVEDAALALVVEKGFDPRYGARGLKREIQRRVVLPLAMTLMEKQIEPGSILRVVARDGRLQVRVVETGQSKAQRRKRDPIKLPDGSTLDLSQVRSRAQELEGRLESLSAAIDEDSLFDQQQSLEHERGESDFWANPERAATVMRDLEQLSLTLDRTERLRLSLEELQTDAAQMQTDMKKAKLERLIQHLLRLEDRILNAERQLVRMGRPGIWDALVHIEPVGKGGEKVRNLLSATYQEWATARNFKVQVLLDPVSTSEATLLAIQGNWAHGLLSREAGLHRLKVDKDSEMVRVRVAPWTDARAQARFGPHRALKGQLGQSGGTLRSRLELQGGLVLQNGRTLADNRELAGELVASWEAAPEPVDEVVRRYCLEPRSLKDHATGLNTQRKDALNGKRFHGLLCQRVDLL